MNDLVVAIKLYRDCQTYKYYDLSNAFIKIQKKKSGCYYSGTFSLIEIVHCMLFIKLI